MNPEPTPSAVSPTTAPATPRHEPTPDELIELGMLAIEEVNLTEAAALEAERTAMPIEPIAPPPWEHPVVPERPAEPVASTPESTPAPTATPQAAPVPEPKSIPKLQADPIEAPLAVHEPPAEVLATQLQPESPPDNPAPVETVLTPQPAAPEPAPPAEGVAAPTVVRPTATTPTLNTGPSRPQRVAPEPDAWDKAAAAALPMATPQPKTPKGMATVAPADIMEYSANSSQLRGISRLRKVSYLLYLMILALAVGILAGGWYIYTILSTNV